MQLFQKSWFSGLLVAAPLLILIPSLALTRLVPPPPAPSDDAVAVTVTAVLPAARPAPPGVEAPAARHTPQPSASGTGLQPVPTPGLWVDSRAEQIPILMYHYIREVDKDADPLGFRLSVRPDRFKEQLAWLRENDYETVRMRELAACLRGEMLCPPRAVALTFDDGYADNALAALPALKHYGFTATFYVVTGQIGREGYMTWAQLEELRDAGMELGAHSVTHADLTTIQRDDADWEIRMSRATLERRLGIKVESFSYPAGSYTPTLALLVQKAGFTSAVTTSPITGLRHLYELPRRRVLGGETIEGYQWYFAPVTPSHS